MARTNPVSSQALGAITAKLERWEKQAEEAGDTSTSNDLFEAGVTLDSLRTTLKRRERSARNGATAEAE